MSFEDTARALEMAIPAHQKWVYAMLCHRMNSVTRRCDPSTGRLATDVGISKSAVKAALRDLKSSGLITPVSRFDGSTNLSNSYVIHGAPDAPVGQDTPPVGQDVTGGGAQCDRGVGQDTPPNKEPQQRREQKKEVARGKVLATLLLKGEQCDYLVCEDDLAKHKRAFPHLDIENEYRRMELWCADNLAERKTVSGIHRFMSGWLSRAPKESNAKPGKYKPQSNRAQQNRDFTKQGIAGAFTELFGADLGGSDGANDGVFPSPACSEGNDEGVGSAMGGPDGDLWPGGFHGRTIASRA